MVIMRLSLVPVIVALAVSTAASQEPLPTNAALIARAKSFELDTPYVPPPGDALEHHTSGFAKIMCSAVFITGLDPDFAAENVGYFTSPYAERAKVGKPVIDRATKTVHITLPSGITRTAKYLGSQGCVTLPIGQSSVNFTPVTVRSGLPDPPRQRWQMGNVPAEGPLLAEINAAKLKQAVNAAFEPAEAMTAAFVVTWRGWLAAERYGEGLTARTPLEGWSMGKSLTATLLGILIKQGVYELSQPALFLSGKPQVIRALKSGLRISFTCRVGYGSRHHKTPITTRQVPIRTTFTFTPAASIPFTTLPRGRCNGLLIQSGVTTTPIQC